MIRTISLLLLLGIVSLPSGILAQDGPNDYTCDDGENDVLNAAQAAFDDGNFEAAHELAGIAEGLCSSDIQRFRAANNLKTRAQAELNRQVLDALEPGFVDVEDYKIFMVCEGEANDTYAPVIFENGLGEDFGTWRDVQPAIAEITLACVYDRLGVGRSDDVPSGDTRTAFEQAETLHLVLAAAEIEGPYVLVGHSIAGLILRGYPYLYPDEIVGLVFVDASHPEQWEPLAAVDPTSAPDLPFLGVERVDWRTSEEELSVVEDFGDLPLAVLHQARDTDTATYPVWLQLQEDHATLSNNSRLIPAENSGHFIHIDGPELVIDAIQWVLDEAMADMDDSLPDSSEAE
jgi:pimeloyl-ACP methyl ester carboxylesterase